MVLGGGFAVHEPALRTAVAARLAAAGLADVRVIHRDPVAGAVRLGPTTPGNRMTTAPQAAAMAAEIAEQPAQWRTLLADAGPELDAVAAADRRYDPHTVLLVARGTSDHAALYAKYLVEIGLGQPGGSGLAVDDDRLRRPARLPRRAHDRRQPVRRLAGPRPVARGRPRRRAR